MAENCALAFGRYLKTLRERRGLSLDDVCSLSQTFPEKLNKGYLSRCENGHQKLAFAKVIPLSRIYEVPADVLVERLELDMELDRVGGPDTEEVSFAELTAAAKKALNEGTNWIAYGYMRDAMKRCRIDPVQPAFRDLDEQCVISQMNCGTAARALGRYRFPLHEYLFLASTGHFSTKFHSIVLERISGCYLTLKEFPLASKYGDMSVAEAESVENNDYLGFSYENRARIALEQSDFETAAAFHNKAYETFKANGRQSECVINLNQLAHCYFQMKRYGAARRTSEASERMALDQNRNRSRAFSLIMLGEIDEIEDRPTQAITRWKEAARVAKELNDRELRFKVECILLRRAIRDSDMPVARSIHRRLRKLSPWINPAHEELQEFRALETLMQSRS